MAQVQTIEGVVSQPPRLLRRLAWGLLPLAWPAVLIGLYVSEPDPKQEVLKRLGGTPPPRWSASDLRDYLDARGVKFWGSGVREARRGGEGPFEEEMLLSRGQGPASRLEVDQLLKAGKPTPDVIFAWKSDSPDSTRRRVGPYGDASFVWAGFLFWGDPVWLEEVWAVLPPEQE